MRTVRRWWAKNWAPMTLLGIVVLTGLMTFGYARVTGSLIPVYAMLGGFFASTVSEPTMLLAKRWPLLDDVGHLLKWIGAGTMFVSLFALFILSLVGWNDLLSEASLPRWGVVTICTMGTLIAGVVLFIFRFFARAVYGASEALVGIVVGGGRAFQEGHWPTDGIAFHLALLTAGAYLVVRGLDNIYQGTRDERTDRILFWVNLGWIDALTRAERLVKEVKSKR